MSLLNNDRIQSPVRCIFSDDEIKLSCTSAVGRANDVISVPIIGESVEIGFNNRYLLDALKNADTDEIKLILNGSLTAMFVKPVYGNISVLNYNFCLSAGFRGSKDSEIINWDENFARIEMRFLGQEREQTAKILFRGGKKSVEINGVQKNSAAALIERFCAVVFSPEHLSLIKRGPGERRKFIDSAICREKLKNAVVLSKYNRILNQRNSLLKDIYRQPSLADTLPVWDEPLLKSGAVLVKNRIDYVKMLSDRAVEYHNGISKGKEELKIRYMSGYEASEDDTVGEIYEKLKCKLEKHKSDDIRTGFTNYGPHRDDIEIIINT